jgi:hypothetical protein
LEPELRGTDAVARILVGQMSAAQLALIGHIRAIAEAAGARLHIEHV